MTQPQLKLLMMTVSHSCDLRCCRGSIPSNYVSLSLSPVVTVEFEPTSYTVFESDRYANITVVKRGQTTQTVNVTFTTADGSATGEYLGGDCNHCPIEPFLSSLVQLDKTTTQYHS